MKTTYKLFLDGVFYKEFDTWNEAFHYWSWNFKERCYFYRIDKDSK